jgi:endonuclease/exonuclease/phosphatase family metal-dependent hydrolase
MVRLIVYNIEYCEGMTGFWYDYLKFWRIFFPPKGLDQKIVDSLRQLSPDIVALVEVDSGSFRSKKRDQGKFFQSQLGMSNFIEKVKYPMTGWLRLFHYVPILNKQANAIIANKKLSDVRYHVFDEGTKRLIIDTTIHIPKKVNLLLAHLSLGKKSRAKQLEELIKIVNKKDNPVILMGDFNTYNGKSEIEKLLKKTHLHHRYKMKDESQILTQPACHPRRCLDYVLTSKKIKVSDYKVLNYNYSDHLPLMVDFRI